MNQSVTPPSNSGPAGNPQASVQARESSNSSSVAWGITVISTITLCLTLLGFGVAIAIEATFNVPHQSVYTSVLDLVGLSVYAIISMVMGLGKITWGPLFEQAWKPGVFVAVGMFLLMVLMVGIRKWMIRNPGSTRNIHQHVKLPTAQDPIGKVIGKSAVFSLLFGSFAFATPFLLIAGLITALAFISMVPMLGMQLGQHYLKQYVVSPKECASIQSAEALQRRWATRKNDDASGAVGAICVELMKDNTRVAIGRTVVSTPSAIVLFEPGHGHTWRIPTGELTIRPVGTIAAVDAPAQEEKKE